MVNYCAAMLMMFSFLHTCFDTCADDVLPYSYFGIYYTNCMFYNFFYIRSDLHIGFV